MNFQTKRIYEKAAATDDCRVLVDRIWPRGVSKEMAQLDRWLKEAAPSSELRQWFDHDRAKWLAFIHRYFLELDDATESIQWLKQQAAERVVTLLDSARDEQHNQAVALKRYLEQTM